MAERTEILNETADFILASKGEIKNLFIGSLQKLTEREIKLLTYFSDILGIICSSIREDDMKVTRGETIIWEKGMEIPD